MAEGEGSAPAEPAKKKSDLGVRTLSAIVMLAIAGGAVWFGSWAWAGFVLLVAVGVLREWVTLAFAISKGTGARVAWVLAGVIYIGVAALMLAMLRLAATDIGPGLLILIVGGVIATDVGAYFAGRTFGGPKIAPKISPSKTWAGLIGAMVATSALSIGMMYPVEGLANLGGKVIAGCLIAIAAQTGDFFESWMKRRAGVKDSSNLIPGHGGLFDRTDGLLAVSFLIALPVGFVMAGVIAA